MNKENNFDLMRLFAAIQVMCFHFIEHFKIKIHYFEYFRYYPGVIIFFAISGYLIYLSLERNENTLKKYLFNRIGRIYPALWFSTVISFILVIISKTYNFKELFSFKGILYWIGQISFFQFWTPDFLKSYGIGTTNGSLWTIIVELQLYIVIIFLYKVFNKKKYIVLIFLFSIIINYLIKGLNHSMIKTLCTVWIIPYLYNFIIGIIFAKFNVLKEKLLDDKVIFWFITYNLWIYLTKAVPDYFINPYSLITNILLSILCLSFVFSYKKISSKILKGIDVSYGIYLFHMVYVNFFIQIYKPAEVPVIIILNSVVLTFISAYISHKFIEKPSLNMIKKLDIYKH